MRSPPRETMPTTSLETRIDPERRALMQLLVCAVPMMSCAAFAKGPGEAMEINEKITFFGVQNDHVVVMFEKSAAGYQIDASREDFAQLVSDVASAWKAKKPVKVRVERAVHIVAVAP